MILDWLNNADAPLVAEPGMPGLVHQGFRDALNELWPLMWPEVSARLAASPGKPIYITGHSKGGALAALAAMRCQAAGLSPYVCTFAAARCGDQDFATGYNAAVTHSVRYEYRDDIVPHLPPDAAFVELFKKIPFVADAVTGLHQGYVSVGELYFIDWQNQIQSDSPALDVQRLMHLATRAVMFEFERHPARSQSGIPAMAMRTWSVPGIWPLPRAGCLIASGAADRRGSFACDAPGSARAPADQQDRAMTAAGGERRHGL